MLARCRQASHHLSEVAKLIITQSAFAPVKQLDLRQFRDATSATRSIWLRVVLRRDCPKKSAWCVSRLTHRFANRALRFGIGSFVSVAFHRRARSRASAADAGNTSPSDRKKLKMRATSRQPSPTLPLPPPVTNGLEHLAAMRPQEMTHRVGRRVPPEQATLVTVQVKPRSICYLYHPKAPERRIQIDADNRGVLRFHAKATKGQSRLHSAWNATTPDVPSCTPYCWPPTSITLPR
jgi:hypothetical protein